MPWTLLRRGGGCALAVAVTASCHPAKPPAPPPVAVARTAPSGPPPIALPPAVPTTTSPRAFLKVDPSFRRCHDDFAATSGARDVRADVARLAGACAAATRMTRVGAPFTGEQAAAGKPQTFHWRAKGGHCYRAYGAGAGGVKNLDLLLVDDGGIVLAQDGRDGPFPVALDGGAVCFKQDDDAALVVSVGDGAGAFAVELWGD